MGYRKFVSGIFPMSLGPERRRTLRRLARGRTMTVSSGLLRQLSALPDWAVLTDQQTSQVLGFSVDTLRRLDRDRNGPPWVKLSPRRRGRPVGGLRDWIKQRVSASFHEPDARVRRHSQQSQRNTRRTNVQT
jgi:hypothetical protein